MSKSPSYPYYGFSLPKHLAPNRSCILTTLEDERYLKIKLFKLFKADLVIGIGGLRNLDIAAKQKSKKLILCDFNENLCEFWQIFSNAISESNSKKDFLEILEKGLKEKRHICANLSDLPEARADILLFKQKMSLEELEETQEEHIDRYMSFMSEALIDAISQMSWFKDKNFGHIKELFAQGYKRIDPNNQEELDSNESKFKSEHELRIAEETLGENANKNNPKVIISKIDLTKSDDLNFLQNLIKTEKDNGSQKMVFNFLNSLDFILAREKRSFTPDKIYITYDEESEEFRNSILSNKSIIKDFAFFLQRTYGNNNVLIADAFLTKENEHDGCYYHTNVLTPEEFLRCRDLESQDIGLITCATGISPCPSFRPKLYDPDSQISNGFTRLVDMLKNRLFSSNNEESSGR